MYNLFINALTITIFVMLMMILIEFINIKTSGHWSSVLKKNKGLQIIIAALLGAIPGCLGVYTVVSMFTHRLISFGALVSAMIATSGDEAFIMLAMMPEQAIWVAIIIFVLAIASGFLSNLIYKNTSFSKKEEHSFSLHQHDTNLKTPPLKQNIKPFLMPLRWGLFFLLLVFAVVLFENNRHHQHFVPDINNLKASENNIGLDLSEKFSDISENHSHEGHHHHETEEDVEAHQHSWLSFANVLFLIIILICLGIVLTASPHFLEAHIWHHVLKKHFFKIFLWILGTLVVIYLVQSYWNWDIQRLAKNNMGLLLIVAILIGIIPQSGPHLVFISLFLSGVIPLSVLIANSIVQDGHGALPLFAENKKAFFYMKLMNVAVAFLFGMIGLWFDF